MAAEEGPVETTVSDRGMVTIPAALRRRLDIEPGDKLRWAIDDGELTVELRKQQYGAFDDLDAVSMGGDGADTHDVAGHERDRTISERN
ncbi:MAG: AbrB/MazE/SpoVT family DNA-binding domain-containing protein [Halodesulfurarchaeum sp.]